MIKTAVLSSLHRVFPDNCPEDGAIKELTAFSNEPVSFQVAYINDDAEALDLPFHTRIDTELNVEQYAVGCVPVLNTLARDFDNPPKPGIYPDMLIPKKTNPPVDIKHLWIDYSFERGEKTLLHAGRQSWQALWFTVNPYGKVTAPGKHNVTVHLISRDTGKEIGVAEIIIHILAARLPKQKLYYTNWFHCDCLADYYDVPMFSDRHFEIIGNYAKIAAKNGMNMILTPAFTPPLDTPIGSERRTTQLVGVTLDHGKYSFDFTLLKRYIDVCTKAGIKYFEHSHLFTQWGARYTPKIMAMKDGKEKRIFGWDKQSFDKPYRDFLHAYLPALFEFLKEENLSKKVFFHMSDEPSGKQLENFKKAKSSLGNLLDGYMSGDALSEFVFYKQGCVKIPIVVTQSAHAFVGKCPGMWCYYTGGQLKDGLSNRLITTTPERNRIIGVQLYYFKIKGFLHWGYNYYYDLLSQGLFDPKINPCGYGNHAGTSYSVYPWRDGTAVESIRQVVFYEAINDIRALEALEKLKGRAFCELLITEFFGEMSFNVCPKNPETLLEFRNLVNKAVENSTANK